MIGAVCAARKCGCPAAAARPRSPACAARPMWSCHRPRRSFVERVDFITSFGYRRGRRPPAAAGPPHRRADAGDHRPVPAGAGPGDEGADVVSIHRGGDARAGAAPNTGWPVRFAAAGGDDAAAHRRRTGGAARPAGAHPARPRRPGRHERPGGRPVHHAGDGGHLLRRGACGGHAALRGGAGARPRRAPGSFRRPQPRRSPPRAGSSAFDVAALYREAATAGTPAIPLVRMLTEQVGAEAGQLRPLGRDQPGRD